jgi:hypothetical protein
MKEHKIFPQKILPLLNINKKKVEKSPVSHSWEDRNAETHKRQIGMSVSGQ